ncbi:hypothetical protein BHE90_002334 [Fusarium euwallaceae]|uniref:Uncharacterized protein n=2 Tax=Fusarium solani species complex TaxID=232080 RepID=A0A3M2S7J0_9HYPO|nr:hypothetical protein CDV36_006786 [Fusarium kuroshium]RTE83151.1 hypothetical protein BHE90_002334 [Fusarium euwallaceae]
MPLLGHFTPRNARTTIVCPTCCVGLVCITLFTAEADMASSMMEKLSGGNTWSSFHCLLPTDRITTRW